MLKSLKHKETQKYLKKVITTETRTTVTPETWSQPKLSSNGTLGTSTFAVARSHSGGSFEGKDAWGAFYTTSGYSSGYYTGNYGNEYSTTFALTIFSKTKLLCTGISFYIPTINSGMDWGSTDTITFQGSNSNGSWKTLTTIKGSSVTQDKQLTFNFTNTTYYTYYKLLIKTIGSGHKDRTAICSVRLIAKQDVTRTGAFENVSYIEGTESDHDVVVTKVEDYTTFDRKVYSKQ